MKIKTKSIPRAYEIARKVFEGELSLHEGRKVLADNEEMNINSAGDFINDFRYMMEGRKFSRTLNAHSMNYFIEHINYDYGITQLSKALSALKQHICYYEDINKVRMHKMWEIYERYLPFVVDLSLDEQEQELIIYEILKDKLTKKELLNELRKVKTTDPKIITFKGKAYKRDNKAVALIKILRDFTCQICGKSIIKKDSTKYIEAAHIKAKHLKGSETLDNIVLLCPNHHKEFDLGDSKISNHTNKSVTITLSGINYEVKFEPDDIEVD